MLELALKGARQDGHGSPSELSCFPSAFFCIVRNRVSRAGRCVHCSETVPFSKRAFSIVGMGGSAPLHGICGGLTCARRARRARRDARAAGGEGRSAGGRIPAPGRRRRRPDLTPGPGLATVLRPLVGRASLRIPRICCCSGSLETRTQTGPKGGPEMEQKRVRNGCKTVTKTGTRTGAETDPETEQERGTKWNQNGTSWDHFGARFAGIAGPVLGPLWDAFLPQKRLPGRRVAQQPARRGTICDPFWTPFRVQVWYLSCSIF